MKESKEPAIKFPLNVLKPLIMYLRGEEKRLLKQKNTLKKEDPFSTIGREDDNSIDADVAEQVDHDRAFAARTEVSKSLINIKKTLSRIKIGKYGICDNCHKMIDTDRLAVKPTAEYCLACEKILESAKRK